MPRRRAKECHKYAVARWLREDFPHIVRASGDRYAYLVLLDELLPADARRAADRGQARPYPGAGRLGSPRLHLGH